MSVAAKQQQSRVGAGAVGRAPAATPHAAAGDVGPTPPPRCGDCGFWQVSAASQVIGECRRLPPLTMTGTPAGPLTYFTRTNVDCWCGEFEPRGRS